MKERIKMSEIDGSSVETGGVVGEPNVHIEKPTEVAGQSTKMEFLIKPGEHQPQLAPNPPEGISPSVEAVRKAGYVEQTVSQARWQSQPVEIKGQLTAGTKPEWWPKDFENEAWENINPEPEERFMSGAAIAVNYYDQNLRFVDRTVNKEEFDKLWHASEAFILYKEQSRIHQRHASVMDKVEEFRVREKTALNKVAPAERDQVRMNVYKLEALQRRKAQLEQDGVVGINPQRHKLYTKVEWENAIKEKVEIESTRTTLTKEIADKLGVNFLQERSSIQQAIIQEQEKYEAEKKQKDQQIAEEEKEFEWEKEYGLPNIFQGKDYMTVDSSIAKQEYLQNENPNLTPDDKKQMREALRNRGINITDTEIFNQAEYDEAKQAQEWFLKEAYDSGLVSDIESTLLDLASNWAEGVAESPGTLSRITPDILSEIRNQSTYENALDWNWLEKMPNQRNDLNNFRGVRGESARRMLQNIYIIMKNLTIIEERRVTSFESTPGLDWEKIQKDLIADQKWYELTQYGTIVFKGKGERAVGLELAGQQFAFDLIHGTSSFDPLKVQERMDYFIRALSAINVEKLAKNEDWSLDQARKFVEHIRHSTVNEASFHIFNWFLDNIMVPQETGYFKDFWAQEGTARMKDLLKEYDGLPPLIMHLLLTKYRMIMGSTGFQGQFVGREHVQWALQENLREVLIQEVMDWELKIDTNKDEALDALTKIKSEDEVKRRYQLKAESPAKVLAEKRKNYRELADNLDQRKHAGDNVTKAEVDALKEARVELEMAKKVYDKTHQNVSSALDSILKVFKTFGISAEVNAPLFITENGDHVNINDLTKALKVASLDAGEKEFADKYGFKDNLALIRARSMAWNGNFAESAVVLKVWETIENNVRRVSTILGKNKENFTFQDSKGTVHLKLTEDDSKKLKDGYIDELDMNLVELYLQIEEVLKQKDKDKILINEIRKLIPEEARESFVKIKVKKEDGVEEEVRFNFAKGYEWTGLTQEEFNKVKETYDQIKKQGYVDLESVLNRIDVEPVLNNFFALYDGTRAELNSEEAIEAAARGEDIWLANNRAQLAKTGRKGFVGLEKVEGTKQQKYSEYALAIAESISFDENQSQLAYVLSTTDENGNFNPDRLSFGRYDGKSRNDYYVGLALTYLGIEVGRMPEITRRIPLHPKPLPKRSGFKTITETVGNSTGFDPIDNWSIITFGMEQEAMQALQGSYKGSFDKEFKFHYAVSDKPINDGDKLRAAEQLTRDIYTEGLYKIIGGLLLGEHPVSTGSEEQLIDAVLERWERFFNMLGPIAYNYQLANGADGTGLGLEFNDNFHNSAIVPVLLSKGGESRLYERGLRAYSAIAKLLLFATFPKGWDDKEDFLKHQYGKGRQGRASVLLGAPTLVRN